jgi:hypothetical protein
MEKLNLTKKYKSYYSASNKPQVVELPPVSYLSIEGVGDPSSKSFADKIQALYSVAYTVKFSSKAQQRDFIVPKLEGLWWFDDRFGKLTMHEAPLLIPRSEWHWRLLIRMPEFITEDMIHEAKSTVITKKNIVLAEETTYFTLNEGKVVQMMHVGPFDREPETLQVMQSFIEKNKFGKAGHHHEIYLSDFRKSAPEKLRTILREPVN